MVQTNIPFSTELENWLSHPKDKTMGSLQQAFGEKSFAILFLICMFIPALPIPTGGITTFVLVPATVFASIQMMFGRKILWLPNFITRVKLGNGTINKGLPFMIKRIRWFERFSRRRLADYIETPWFRSLNGFMVLIFALGSLIAPPFSGLDTLPSMGAVIVALGIILEDVLMIIIGFIVGLFGLGVIVAAASVVIAFLERVF